MSFDDLVQSSTQFQSTITRIPTLKNQILQVANSGKYGSSESVKQEIELMAKGVRIILNSKTRLVIEDFLKRKRAVDPFFERMSFEKYVARLVSKRPLVFMDGSDYTVLRDGRTEFSNGVSLWKGISSLKQNPSLEESSNSGKHFTMNEYLSYEEIAISALIGVSVPTFFINDGKRHNAGVPQEKGSFVEEGIFVALVGARFEISDEMESRFIVVQRDGKKLYDEDGEWRHVYPKETNTFCLDRFHPIPWLKGADFDALAYRQRMRVPFDTFLQEAESRAMEYGKKAVVRLVGLGLGVWQLHKKIQTEVYVEEFIAILSDSHCSNIRAVEFCWIDPPPELKDIPKHVQTKANISVSVSFTKNNPASKIELEDGDGSDCLLVASYAWDGNSFPGNEYWVGSLAASGDPAAACCSLIPELQNPCINTQFLSNIRVFDAIDRC